MSKIVIVSLKDCLSDNLEHTQSIFDELRTLQKKDIKIYVFGDYTQAAINSIKAKYERSIPGTQFFSFNHLGTEKGLLDALLNMINVEHGLYNNDIALFYKPPVEREISLLRHIYNAFVFLLEQCFGRNRTIPAVMQDEQLPYHSIAIPDLKQRSLREVLENDLHWEFKEPKPKTPALPKSILKTPRKRKIKDPTFKLPKSESSEDSGYECEVDRKAAVTPQLKTVKTAKAKKTVQFALPEVSSSSLRPSPADKTLTRR